MLRVFLIALTTVALLCSACSDNSTGTGDTKPPAGRTRGFTGCKTPLAPLAHGDYAIGQACVEYAYDGRSILQLTHVNGVFNCCPDSVGGEIRITDHSITIDEAEWLSNPCDCVCPFDVDYEITGLPPGSYTIRVNELYLHEGAALLEITVDLAVRPSGSFCVERDLPFVGIQ